MNRKAFGESFLYWVDFMESFFNSKEFCQTVWTLWTPRIILSKVMLKWWQLVCLRGDTVLSATSERLLLHIFCSLFWQDLGAKNLMRWPNATMFVLFQKYAIYFSRCLKCRHSAKNLHSSHFRNYNHSAKFEGTFEKLIFLGHPAKIEVCLNDTIDFDANSVYWR